MDEIPEMRWMHVDTMQLLQTMYDEEELAVVLMSLMNSNGWWIIPFNDPPVFDYVETSTIQRYNWRLN